MDHTAVTIEGAFWAPRLRAVREQSLPRRYEQFKQNGHLAAFRGDLSVWFTVVEPEKRWTNLRDWHELYCAGHLIKAAVAHYQATGKRTLLEVTCPMKPPMQKPAPRLA